MNVIAYCNKDAAIHFGAAIPDGAFGIARGNKDVLAKVLAGTAIVEVNSNTLIVPGMRESNSERGALTALAQFIQRLDQIDQPGFRALGA